MAGRPSLLERVQRCWQSLGSPPPGVVIALSGGFDSVALTRAVLAVRPDPAIPVVLAHLNHRLRGADSDSDEAFVVDLYNRLSATLSNLHLAVERLDIAHLAQQQRDNLEAVARRERYRWLAVVARQRGLRFVLTAHTANDQAETLLHRLIRGTGLDGLRGIAARRALSAEVEVVRPLLLCERAEVEAYLSQLGQSARHDASNDDPRFTRNRIRHQLLPLLAREYNPRIHIVLSRLATQIHEISTAEANRAIAWLTRAERPRAGNLVILDAGTLRRAPRRLIRGVFRHLWHREGWPVDGLGFVELERLADLVFADSGAHDLPGGIHVRRRGTVLQLRGKAEGTAH
jgi:tRNA(Ile)-lysidine synthase